MVLKRPGDFRHWIIKEAMAILSATEILKPAQKWYHGYLWSIVGLFCLLLMAGCAMYPGIGPQRVAVYPSPFLVNEKRAPIDGRQVFSPSPVVVQQDMVQWFLDRGTRPDSRNYAQPVSGIVQPYNFGNAYGGAMMGRGF